MACGYVIFYRCFQSTKRGFFFLRHLLEMRSLHSLSHLAQVILTPKFLSHCDIPFKFITVGLTVWEGDQTGEAGSGLGLAWLSVTYLPLASGSCQGLSTPYLVLAVLCSLSFSLRVWAARPAWFLQGILGPHRGLRTLLQPLGCFTPKGSDFHGGYKNAIFIGSPGEGLGLFIRSGDSLGTRVSVWAGFLRSVQFPFSLSPHRSQFCLKINFEQTFLKVKERE